MASSSTVIASLCSVLVTIIGSPYAAIVAVVAPAFIVAFNARVIAVAAISPRLVVCAAGKKECRCS